MTIDRRRLLKTAAIALGGVVGAVAAGESLAGCDTSHKSSPPSPSRAASTNSATAQAGTGATTSSAAPNSVSPTQGQAPSGSVTPAPNPGGKTAPPTATAGHGRAIEIVRGPASATGVALTFHGAGDPRLAVQLLDEVDAAGAKVTVFAVGSWLEQQPQMAKRLLDHGHELGNHTYRHLTMPRLTSAVDDSEITRCADLLRRLTGTQGRWFRPSGTTHATPAILDAAGRAGYAESVSFDVDPLDYADPGTAAIVSRVLAGARAGSIVSLHLGHPGTVQAIPAILDGLRKRALPAVSMSSLMST
jgi:peptidoglycan/xylan/chitin deacetylase (PgdA/CDA1 family)